MTETSDSDYTNVSVPDEDLPEELQPGEDNPLAEPPTEDADRQDLGDPHMEGLERERDDTLSIPESDDDSDADSDGES
jgi:hypothetical protein